MRGQSQGAPTGGQAPGVDRVDRDIRGGRVAEERPVRFADRRRIGVPRPLWQNARAFADEHDGSTLGGGLSLLEPTATATLAGVELLSAGANHTCAYTSAGVTYCWGDTTYGQLGSGEATSLERVNAPRPVVW